MSPGQGEVDELAARLKAAAEAASQLEAAETDADRASLLVGLRDVADYAARDGALASAGGALTRTWSLPVTGSASR